MSSELLTDWSVARMLTALRSSELSPVELIQAHLDRIAEINPTINAIVTFRAEEALAEAKEAEKAIAAGAAGELAGLPFTVKDTIETAGVRTTAGSKLLAGKVPERDAPAVGRLRSAGAILLGKTNTPEFAMTFSTDNAIFGRTKNPRDLDLTPGGSSGGEAAVIAAGGSPLGLGSDLAGSIRVPANFCRIYGLRPTAGRVPSAGQVPYLPHPLGSLSVIGPLARNPEDIDLFMRVSDPSWDIVSSDRCRSVPDADVKKTVGFFLEVECVPTSREVKAAVHRGAAEIVAWQDVATEEINPIGLSELFDLWDEIWWGLGGARGLLAGYFAGREQDLSPSLKRQVEGSPVPDPGRVAHAWARVVEIRREMLVLMEGHPLVVCPVAAGPATERPGQWTIGGIEFRGARGFAYSYCWSLLGFPAIAVASSRDDLPGFQIVARPGHDEEAVALARKLHRQTEDDPEPYPIHSAISVTQNARSPIGRALQPRA